jgi:hypothetical protein
MNKKIVLGVMLVGILAFGLVMVSCGNGNSRLVGTWESSEDGIMELSKDGTGKIDGTNIKWRTEKNNFIMSAYGIEITGEYKLSGSTLTVNADGDTSVFKKKK